MKRTRFTALILCAVMLMSLLFTGCSSKPALKVGGENIPGGYYAYYYGYLYNSLGAYINYDDELLDEYTISQIKQTQAIKQLAKENKIELTALETKSVIDAQRESIAKMGQAAYATFLKSIGLKDKQYLDISKSYALYSKLYSYFYNAETGIEAPSEEEILEDYKNTNIRATHIFFNCQEAGTEDERKDIYKRAEEVYAKVEAGENFYGLIREYGEDPGVANSPELGYYFNDKSGFDPAFTAAAYALEENKYSEIIESSMGYHIILRLPMDDDYIREQINAENSSIRESYCQTLFAEKLAAIADAMEVVKLEAFDAMDLSGAIAVWATSSTQQ